MHTVAYTRSDVHILTQQGCDGVWDVVDPEEAVTHTHTHTPTVAKTLCWAAVIMPSPRFRYTHTYPKQHTHK